MSESIETIIATFRKEIAQYKESFKEGTIAGDWKYWDRLEELCAFAELGPQTIETLINKIPAGWVCKIFPPDKITDFFEVVIKSQSWDECNHGVGENHFIGKGKTPRGAVYQAWKAYTKRHPQEVDANG